jgi:hypothetical protein
MSLVGRVEDSGEEVSGRRSRRAVTSAIRLAIDPPVVSRPSAEEG